MNQKEFDDMTGEHNAVIDKVVRHLIDTGEAAMGAVLLQTFMSAQSDVYMAGMLEGAEAMCDEFAGK